tara:strand:- start:3 stop:434 length:432 start_codon:yes stop_codon:yes gene_type:complete
MRIILCVLLLTSNALACDYESNDEIQFKGSIESVRIIDKKVYPYVDDTRICTMHIESRINGEWYSSKSKYIFGSEMSEDTACSLAENRAKVKVMREEIPETLTSKRNLSCDLTTDRNSCRIIYMNVEMPVVGTQRVKLKTCEE